MTKILGFIFGDLITGWVIKGIYITVVALFYGLIISTVVFVTGALMTTYTLTTDVLTFIESYSASASSSNNDVMSAFFQLLSCIGVIDAFNATKIMFFSSFSFLLMRLLYLQIISILLVFHKLMTPLIGK